MNEQTQAQFSFSNANARIAGALTHSGCPVTVIDWNNDGLDDLVRLDDGHIASVDIQQPNQQFTHVLLGDFGGGSGWAWSMCVADIDHNGYKDIVAGGYNDGMVLMSNNTGTGATLISLPSSGFFWQNITFGDFNNDGWIDVFACDDNNAAKIYMNDGAGNLNISTFVNFAVNPTIFYGNDPADSGNYGSVWTDFDNDGDMDLFVAHCRQSTSSPSDLRRKDRLFVNDGNNNFTEQSSTYGIEVSAFNQTWTASFGDIDNDGDLDLMVTNHDVASQILENDGTGHYSDITTGSGFSLSNMTPLESVMEDFDNDGFLDILVTGSASRLFHNNGDKTFTLVSGLFDNNNMESFAVGDLNHDGWMDIYASYAGIYTDPDPNVADVMWMNNGSINSIVNRAMPGSQVSSVANNFFNLVLEGTVSNHDAIGARALVYSALGTQLREVRSGESYGTVNSGTLHFGLGTISTIDSVVIQWPSGTAQTIVSPAINQFLTVIEGTCVSPEAIVTASGPLVLCSSGQSITLTAPAGHNYLWSDGSTNQSLTVSQVGEYFVNVSDAGNSCTATSATITVIPAPDETPSIALSGFFDFACYGSSIQINGPSGLSSYLWSNGDTTQNAIATQSGNYTLTTQGICQAYTSDPLTVTILSPVIDPSAADVSLPSSGSATLNATGNNISWYATSSGGTPLATGNSFITPVVSTNTTYYMQSTDTYGGGISSVGLPNYSGTGSGYPGASTNASMYFDVTKSCTLNSVKVYTGTAGTRRIQLLDNTGTVINYADVNILPDSQVVTLNFPLTPGTDYILTTDGATNQANLGNTSPILKRNSSGVNYPYTMVDGITITHSSASNQYFYYFYDWQVEKPSITCVSNFVPVNVFITVGFNELSAEGISVYPNPANDLVTVKTTTGKASMVTIFDAMSRIVKQQVVSNTETNVSLDGLAAGVYQLQLQKDGKTHNMKLVKN